MFADALAEQGWSVWWDRVIPPGKQFDDVIEEALDAARCVVVLWSQASAASTWVKTEAAEAMRRKALIPAVIEDVKIPLEFRRLQAADLSRWQGDRSDPQLLHFFKSIEAELKRPRSTAEPTVTPEEAPAVEQPKRPEPPPRPVPPLHSGELKQKRKLSPAVIGAIVAVIVALLGAGIYYERARSIALAEQGAREKAAEEQADRERDQAARPAAKRKGPEDWKAKAAAAAERTAPQGQEWKPKLPAAAERPAPQGQQWKPKPPAAAERPALQGEERKPKSAAVAERPAPQGVPAAGVLNLQWRDHALGFSGALTWNPSSAMLRVAVVDLKTGARIGNYAVPALISQQAPVVHVVTAEFAVPGDSATPGPHTHTSRLLIRVQPDGSLRFLQNCPRPGECY